MLLRRPQALRTLPRAALPTVPGAMTWMMAGKSTRRSAVKTTRSGWNAGSREGNRNEFESQNVKEL